MFIPFVLLVQDADGETTRDPWKHADEVVELPVQRGALRSRVATLVQRRRTAVRLADRERRLEAAVEALREKERATDVEIETEDDGPGIPERETTVLNRGETSLKHADGLGIWLMY